MPILITAALCTYNRADLLAGAIESLCKQTLSPKDYEILVVDNASTDSTRTLVEILRPGYDEHEIRYIYEPTSGTGYARNLAARQARADYIAYIDDDAQADPEWLRQALNIIHEYNRPACLGGPIYPFFTSSKPKWFLDQYETRSLGNSIKLVRPMMAFSGSNMIWRKDVLMSIGGFGEDLGPTGNDFAIGEDSAAFRKLWRQDASSVVVYSPDLRVYHWVPETKMRVAYHFKRAFLSGQADFRVLGRSSIAFRGKVLLRGAAYIMIQGLRSLGRFKRYRYWQNWAIEEGRLISDRLGRMCAALGLYFTLKRS
jgi:GT2 family glycosyltransferase